MSDRLSDEALVQLKLGHLQMIQGIISRLSGYSAASKNFCVTLVGAAVFINVSENGNDWLPLVAIGIVLFAALDLYYLVHERAFRSTYRCVAVRPLAQADDLAIVRGKSDFGAIGSFSIWGFYGPQIVVILLLMRFGDCLK